MTLKKWLAVALAVGFATGCPSGDDEDEVVETDTEVVETDTEVTDTDPTAACVEEEDFETCAGCCAEALPDAYDMFNAYVIYACACVEEAACYDVCTAEDHDVCSEESPSTDCQACLQAEANDAQSECGAAGVQACADDADCLPVLACVQDCPEP